MQLKLIVLKWTDPLVPIKTPARPQKGMHESCQVPYKTFQRKIYLILPGVAIEDGVSVRHWPQIPIAANKPSAWQASHGISTALLLSSKFLLRYTVLLVTTSSEYQTRLKIEILKCLSILFPLLILLLIHTVENCYFKYMNFTVNCCE